MASTGKSSSVNNEAVPIFLRKTYHMIDTCDANIACWSEDGETFVVKNTDVFEKTIIPQFFKHSKFSSFVRQLNFYGFRKIKYADTIRIDPKLEAATANFWRFRHEKFQRGKPEQLIDIKRSNGQQTTSTSSTSNASEKTEDAGLKNEVNILKKRIEAMTKDIDQLTTLVQKVTIKEERSPTMKAETEVGSKRKKMDTAAIRPDEALSYSMELDDFNFAPNDLPNIPAPVPSVQRESSVSSSQTDDDFVEQLFTAFGADEMGGLMEEIPMPNTQPMEQTEENSPDPKLMKKLSGALALLPREIQEMIVNRLVATITGTEAIEKNVKAVSALSDASRVTKVIPGGKVAPNQVPPSPVLEGRQPDPLPEQMPLPLAAATLAALLTHFNSNVKDKAVLQKTLPPVIPIHA